MRTWLVIYLKELRSFFLSPFAFVVMALFTFLNGWHFIAWVETMQSRSLFFNLVYSVFTSGLFWMGFFFLFPLITMRLFAEEKKMGTYEGLMTAPVRTIEVLLAKYAAAFTFYLAILTPILLFFPVFKMVTGEQGAFHNGALYGSSWCLILVGAFNIAIGTLASAITSNQLIAAMVTFVGVMLHYFLSYLKAFVKLQDSMWDRAMSYFSTIEHMQTMSQGLIDSRPFVYYLSFAALLLTITWHLLESRKWRV